MILNLPEDSYPYDVTISDAKFVTNDGEEIILDSVNSITEATLDKEGGFRIHIRPVDEVDKDSGEVTVPASPEVAGWDQEGAFKGGTLSMNGEITSFACKRKAESAAESKADDSKTESKADDSKTDSKAEDSKADSKASNTTTTGKTTTTTITTASASSAASDATENNNSNTGAAAGTVFGLLALAGAGAVVSRKKK